MDMKDKNRSLIKEYAMKWNLHDIKRACQVNGFPAFFGIVMLFGLLSGGVSRADEEIFVSDFLTGLAVLLPIGLVWLSICLHPVIYALSDFLIMILSWLVKQSLRAFLFQEVQP